MKELAIRVPLAPVAQEEKGCELRHWYDLVPLFETLVEAGWTLGNPDSDVLSAVPELVEQLHRKWTSSRKDKLLLIFPGVKNLETAQWVQLEAGTKRDLDETARRGTLTVDGTRLGVWGGNRLYPAPLVLSFLLPTTPDSRVSPASTERQLESVRIAERFRHLWALRGLV